MTKMNPLYAKVTSAAEKTLRISFKKKRLLQASLFHPSFRNENPSIKLEDFDRLEFFGDCILNFIVCRKLYVKFPDADEGLLSRLRSILVSRKILDRITRKIKLHKLIKLGRSLSLQENFSFVKIHADSFEALIAAYYFDKGFPKTEKWLLKIFTGYFDIKKLFRLDPNPKSTLQELVQRHWQKLPIYSGESTPQGSTTIVSVHQRLKATAKGFNRKESEEKAARLLLRKVRQELVRRSKKKSSGKKLRKTF